MSSSSSDGRRSRVGRSIAWFLGLFAVYVVLGYALLALPWVERGFVEPWTRLNVRAAAAFAGPFIEGVRAIDTQLIAIGAVPLEARSAWGRKLARGELVASVEIMPPRSWDASAVIEPARKLKVAGVDAISIVESPRARSRMGARNGHARRSGRLS